MFVAGAGVAGSAGLGVAVAPKLKRPVEAGAGVLSSFLDSDVAPNPPNAGAGAGVALPFCVAPPPKLNMPVEAGAGVAAGAALELLAPNWNPAPGVAGAGVAPNWKEGVEEAAALLPKLKGEAGAGVLGSGAADEPAPPKLKGVVDAPLVVPNMLVDPDALLVLLWSAPNGLLAGWLPNIEPEPPNAVGAPFVAGAPPLVAPNGLCVGVPAEKLKPLPVCWLLLWLSAPNVNELLLNMLFESEAGAEGGKLLVVVLPKPPNMPPDPFAPFSAPPPMGAVAPKLKPPGAGG